MPPEVETGEICWPLGLPPDPQSPGLCQVRREAWTLAGSLPPAFPEREARVWGAGRVRLLVDATTGRRLSASCRQPHAGRAMEVARWPSLAYPWLTSGQRRASPIPALAADCADDAYSRMENLRIEGPPPDSLLAQAPGSRVAPTVRLRALGTSSRVQWLVNGRLAAETQGARAWTHEFSVPGEQTISALAAGGAWAELRLRVLP
jgi:penicillin-binding protein 1C